MRPHVELRVNNRFDEIELQSLPRFVRLLHVEPIDFKVPIIKPANLKHVSIIHSYESWMNLADGNVRQLLPLILVNVIAVTVFFTNRH